MGSGEMDDLMNPPDRPIVERPEPPESRKFAEFPGQWAMDAWAYIEWQEKERERLESAIRQKDNALEVYENELHQAQAIIEGLTAERDRAEATLRNVER